MAEIYPFKTSLDIVMNILRIDASLRKTESYSRCLTDKLVQQLMNKQKTPEESSQLVVRDLADGISLIDDHWTKANFTVASERTTEQEKCLSESHVLVNELHDADSIVIGLPIYNFNVPTAFRAWIDQVVRSKLTFRYTDNGPIGLLMNKKAYIVIVSGGTKLGSGIDFIKGYLQHILGFMGINDITILDYSALGSDETRTLSHAQKSIEKI